MMHVGGGETWMNGGFRHVLAASRASGKDLLGSDLPLRFAKPRAREQIEAHISSG